MIFLYILAKSKSIWRRIGTKLTERREVNSNMKRRLKGERPRWNRFQHYFPSNEFVESGILKWGIICHHTENFSGERKTDRKEILTDNPRKAFFLSRSNIFWAKKKRNNKKLEKHSGDFNKVREMKKSRGGERALCTLQRLALVLFQ